MSAVRFSPRRVAIIAHNTLLEALRQKLLTALLVLSLALVASARFFGEFNFGSSELKFIADFGFGAMTLFGSTLAIVAAAQLFFSEVENRTALTLLAKPVLRSEFVLGKFTGAWLVLLAFAGLVGLAVIAVLFWRESALNDAHPEAFAHGRLVAYGSVMMFVALQWLKFGVIAAFTILIASFSQTNLYSVVMAFLVLVICHLQYLAQDAWERSELGIGRWIVTAFGLLFPNFQLFNVGDRVAAGHALSWSIASPIAGYAVIYIAVLLALAVFSFRRREI